MPIRENETFFYGISDLPRHPRVSQETGNLEGYPSITMRNNTTQESVWTNNILSHESKRL